MQYDVVLEGGGAKGMVFVGAFEEFEKRGHTIARMVGTSAGAITATILACGYAAKELRSVIERRTAKGHLIFADVLDAPRKFTDEQLAASKFAQTLLKLDFPLLPPAVDQKVARAMLAVLLKFGWFRQFFSFVEYGGFYEGRRTLEWLQGVMEEKQKGFGQATFAELYKATGKDLTLVASDLDAGHILAMNHRTAPDVPVSWGARMSMSIPMCWQEVRWRKEWGTYRGRDMTDHSVVDGGILSNFPIDLIATDLQDVIEIMGPGDPRAVPNLGLLIDDEAWAPEFGKARYVPAVLEGAMQRSFKLMDTMMSARVSDVLEKCLANEEVCRLPAGGYDIINFDLSPERFDAIVRAGRRVMGEYFDKLERTTAAKAAAAKAT